MTNYEIALMLVRYMIQNGDLPAELKRLLNPEAAHLMVYLAWQHTQQPNAAP